MVFGPLPKDGYCHLGECSTARALGVVVLGHSSAPLYFVGIQLYLAPECCTATLTYVSLVHNSGVTLWNKAEPLLPQHGTGGR